MFAFLITILAMIPMSMLPMGDGKKKQKIELVDYIYQPPNNAPSTISINDGIIVSRRSTAIDSNLILLSTGGGTVDMLTYRAIGASTLKLTYNGSGTSEINCNIGRIGHKLSAPAPGIVRLIYSYTNGGMLQYEWRYAQLTVALPSDNVQNATIDFTSIDADRIASCAFGETTIQSDSGTYHIHPAKDANIGIYGFYVVENNKFFGDANYKEYKP